MRDTPIILTQDEARPPCGDEPTWLCESLLNWTGNETLARAFDIFIDTPGRILLVLILAFIASALVRRFTGRLVRRMREPGATGKFGEVLGRTVTKSLFDDRPQTAARRRQRADAIGGLVRGAAVFVIWIIAAFMILDLFRIDIRPLLAGAGIVGIALGFGAQNLVRDLLAGIFMLIEDQYGVGDVVDVGKTSGVVESVGIRVTRLRDVNGVLWHVPNGIIEAVGNMSQEWSRALLDIEVAYGTDLARAKRVIKDVADRMWQDDEHWGEILLAEPEIWGVEALGASGITIRLVVRTKPIEQWNVARELRARLVAAFEEERITIPFPQQVVWLRQGDDEGSPVRPRHRTRDSVGIETEPETPTEARDEPREETVTDSADEGDRMPPPGQSGPEGTSGSGGVDSGTGR